MDIHVYLHDATADAKLTQILTRLDALMALEKTMDAATQARLDALNTEVSKQTTLEASVETLLNGLVAQIAALKTTQSDPAVLAALDSAIAAVAANNTKLTAAAVAANV